MVNTELQTHYKMSVLYLESMFGARPHTELYSALQCRYIDFLDNLCLYTFTDGASGSQNRKNLSKEREVRLCANLR